MILNHFEDILFYFKVITTFNFDVQRIIDNWKIFHTFYIKKKIEVTKILENEFVINF